LENIVTILDYRSLAIVSNVACLCSLTLLTITKVEVGETGLLLLINPHSNPAEERVLYSNKE